MRQPLLNYIEFAGIHTDPSLRCEGNRNPELAACSDDQAAQTTGFRAAGAAALIPFFAREGSGSSNHSFKAIYPGLVAPGQVIPGTVCALFFHCIIQKLDLKESGNMSRKKPLVEMVFPLAASMFFEEE